MAICAQPFCLHGYVTVGDLPLPALAVDSAALLARVFSVDMTRCPTCDGRLRLVAVLSDPASIRRLRTLYAPHVESFEGNLTTLKL